MDSEVYQCLGDQLMKYNSALEAISILRPHAMSAYYWLSSLFKFACSKDKDEETNLISLIDYSVRRGSCQWKLGGSLHFLTLLVHNYPIIVGFLVNLITSYREIGSEFFPFVGQTLKFIH